MNKKEVARKLFPGFRKWLTKNEVDPSSYTVAEWSQLSLNVLWEEYQTQLIQYMHEQESKIVENPNQMKLPLDELTPEEVSEEDDSNEPVEITSQAS